MVTLAAGRGASPRVLDGRTLVRVGGVSLAVTGSSSGSSRGNSNRFTWSRGQGATRFTFLALTLTITLLALPTVSSSSKHRSGLRAQHQPIPSEHVRDIPDLFPSIPLPLLPLCHSYTRSISCLGPSPSCVSPNSTCCPARCITMQSCSHQGKVHATGHTRALDRQRGPDKCVQGQHVDIGQCRGCPGYQSQSTKHNQSVVLGVQCCCVSRAGRGRAAARIGAGPHVCVEVKDVEIAKEGAACHAAEHEQASAHHSHRVPVPRRGDTARALDALPCTSHHIKEIDIRGVYRVHALLPTAKHDQVRVNHSHCVRSPRRGRRPTDFGRTPCPCCCVQKVNVTEVALGLGASKDNQFVQQRDESRSMIVAQRRCLTRALWLAPFKGFKVKNMNVVQWRLECCARKQQQVCGRHQATRVTQARCRPHSRTGLGLALFRRCTLFCLPVTHHIPRVRRWCVHRRQKRVEFPIIHF
eukprot:m.136099 g.136099  ORF g.136099 m.136099 type:complete len:469 (-) comp14883_c8_seq2:2453-3859(-)